MRILSLILITLYFSVYTYEYQIESHWHFVPPADALVVNVKDYGAMGDGKTDDTKAIAQAITKYIDTSRYRANPFFYFPNGTYLVTGPIEGKNRDNNWSAHWRAGFSMIGESRTDTIIKLSDHNSKYQNPKKPQWVIACGSEHEKRTNHHGGGNRAFRHHVLNLTVDVGQGNPGAIGIDFISSNRGSVEGVTIKAPEGSGHTGIAMTRNWPGPAMIQDVIIDGFATGIAMRHWQYGMTFEKIQMRNQSKIGIRNTDNVLTMRNIDFKGSVPFYMGSGKGSMLCLLDSTIIGENTRSLDAISCGAFLNLHRVTVAGYKNVAVKARYRYNKKTKQSQQVSYQIVKSAKNGTKEFIPQLDIGQTYHGKGKGKKQATWLHLPIEDAPIFRPKPEQWTYGGNSSKSIQAVIDNGAEYIYLPARTCIKLTDTLKIRGNVKLIMGMASCIIAPKGKAAVRIEHGKSPAVAMEYISCQGRIDHVSKRTFILRHSDHKGFHASGAGKTHIVDVIGKDYVIGKKHTIWARQLNAEFGNEPLMTNSGTAWILGFKMESSRRGKDKNGNTSTGTPSILNTSGSLELYGGLLYTLGDKKNHAPTIPAFTNEKGGIALSWRRNGIPATIYPLLLRVDDFKEGTDVLKRSDMKGTGFALIADQR